MGSIINGTLEITNCYAVNYTFEEDAIVDRLCWLSSCRPTSRSNSTRLWPSCTRPQTKRNRLSAGADSSTYSSLRFSTTTSPVKAEKKWYTLNHYYRSLCQVFKPVGVCRCCHPQIFLTVNVTFEGESIAIDAYSVTSIVLNGDILAIKFTRLPVTTTASDVENQVITSMNAFQNVVVELGRHD